MNVVIYGLHDELKPCEHKYEPHRAAITGLYMLCEYCHEEREMTDEEVNDYHNAELPYNEDHALAIEDGVELYDELTPCEHKDVVMLDGFDFIAECEYCGRGRPATDAEIADYGEGWGGEQHTTYVGDARGEHDLTL